MLVMATMIRRPPRSINHVPVIGRVTRVAVVTLAPRTLDAYRSDWADFVGWCAARGLEALPAGPDTLVAYVDDRAGVLRVSTLKRRLAAIRSVHLRCGQAAATDAPAVTAAMTRARWKQRHVVGGTTPISVEELRAMSRALPGTVAGVRDRAIILAGYGAALRPGELVALRADDLSVGRSGLRVASARGVVHVPFGSAVELCAVTAWTAWTACHSGAAGTPAFRPVDRFGRVGPRGLGEKAIGRIVRRAAAGAGLDADRFSGRSLRRGMVDAAAANGASRRLIMRQTGHRSERLVRDYMGVAAPSA
jgi:integrase